MNFRRRLFLCTTLYGNLMQACNFVAHLTLFSFEFLYEFFIEDASLCLLYYSAKKSKMTKNSNQGGPALKTKTFGVYMGVGWGGPSPQPQSPVYALAWTNKHAHTHSHQGTLTYPQGRTYTHINNNTKNYWKQIVCEVARDDKQYLKQSAVCKAQISSMGVTKST